MKLARVLLSVLLAVLLPLQGAVAAAMLCPHELASLQAQGQEVSQPDDSMTDHEDMLVGDGIDEPHQHRHADQKAGQCRLCAACCSGAALVSVWPTHLRFVRKAAETFVLARAPATRFISGGQERPPRSS